MYERISRILLIAGAALWCLLIVVAPALHSHFIYAFFSTICHQQRTRSWFIAGEPLPVCIRCSCIYFGFLLGACGSRRPNLRFLEIAIALTLGEFLVAGLVLDSEWLRAGSGLLLGLAVAPFVRIGIQQMLQTRLRRAAV